MSSSSSKCSPLFVGFRRAGLVASVREGRVEALAFSALNRPDLFDVRAEAACRLRTHTPPDPQCSCGFYSLRSRDRIIRGEFTGANTSTPWDVMLQVQLSGTVVEGSAGLRASHQTVKALELILPCHVPGCVRLPSWLLVSDSLVAINQLGRWTFVVGVCDEHAERSPAVPLLSFEEASALLGVRVFVAQELRTSAAHAFSSSSDPATQLRSQLGLPHPAPFRPPAGPQPGASQAETNAVLVWLGSSFMISFTVGAALIRALIPNHGPLDVAWHSTFLQVAAGCVLLYAVVVLAGVFSLRRLTGRAFVRGWEFSSAGLALLGFGLAAVAALRFSEAPGELASVFSAVLAAVLGGAAGGVLLSVVRRLAATGRSCWRLTVPLLLAAASVWFLVLSSGPRVSAPDLAAVAEVATRLAADPSLSSRMLEGAVSEPGLVAVAWGSQADGSSGSAALFWLEADGRTCWQVPVPSSSGARPLDDAVSVRLPDEFAASSPPVCSPEAFSALG